MPDIPEYTAQVSPEGSLVLPDTPTVGEAVGAGLQNVGQGMSDYATDMAKAQKILAGIQQQRDLKSAAVGYQQFSNDTDARQATAEQNVQPGAPGFVDQQLQDFDQRSADFMKSVPDTAKEYAQEQVLKLRGAVQTSSIDFQTKSADVYEKQLSDSLIGNASTGLVNNPGKLPLTVSSVNDAIDGLHLSPTNTETAKSMALQKLTSAALGGRVMQDPNGALADMKAGKFDAAGADDLAIYENQAVARVNAANAQAREEERQKQFIAQADLKDRVSLAIPSLQTTAVMPTGDNGRPLLTTDEIRQTIPGPEGDLLIRQVTAAQQEGNDALTIRRTALPDDYTKLDAMTHPAPGTVVSEQDQERAQAFAQAVQRKANILQNDPASWVAGQRGPVADAWTARAQVLADPKSTPQQIASATSVAVGATVQAQIAAGVPAWQAKPLTKAQSQGYVGQMKTANPDQLASIAAEVESLGPQAVSQVVADGAPDGFATILASNDPVFRASAAKAMFTPPDQLDGMLKSAGAGVTRDQVSQAVQNKMAQLYATMPPSTRGLYQNGLTDLAITNLGAANGDPVKAADMATKAVTGEFNVPDGKPAVRVSADLNPGQVSRGLDLNLADLLSGASGVKIVPPPAPPGVDAMQALREARGQLQWLTNEAGDGAILALKNGRYLQVVNRTSTAAAPSLTRYEVKFSDAQRVGAATPVGIGDQTRKLHGGQ